MKKKQFKKLSQFVFFYFGRSIHFVYSYSTAEFFKKIFKGFYSSWISSEFKTIGNQSTIAYPLELHGGKYISIGQNSYIGQRTTLSAWDKYESDFFNPEIRIGNNVIISDDGHITAINKIVIGNNVVLGKKVTITDNSHGKSDYESLSIPPILRLLHSKGPVIIEDGVWIGDKVTILPGVRIGENSIIGANALVTKDVPANCVVGGVPAKLIKIIK